MAHKMTHTRSKGLSALETALTYVEQQSEASVNGRVDVSAMAGSRGEKSQSAGKQTLITFFSYTLYAYCILIFH